MEKHYAFALEVGIMAQAAHHPSSSREGHKQLYDPWSAMDIVAAFREHEMDTPFGDIIAGLSAQIEQRGLDKTFAVLECEQAFVEYLKVRRIHLSDSLKYHTYVLDLSSLKRCVRLTSQACDEALLQFLAMHWDDLDPKVGQTIKSHLTFDQATFDEIRELYTTKMAEQREGLYEEAEETLRKRGDVHMAGVWRMMVDDNKAQRTALQRDRDNLQAALHNLGHSCVPASELPASDDFGSASVAPTPQQVT